MLNHYITDFMDFPINIQLKSNFSYLIQSQCCFDLKFLSILILIELFIFNSDDMNPMLIPNVNLNLMSEQIIHIQLDYNHELQLYWLNSDYLYFELKFDEWCHKCCHFAKILCVWASFSSFASLKSAMIFCNERNFVNLQYNYYPDSILIKSRHNFEPKWELLLLV